MKNIVKNILIPVAAFLLLTLPACSLEEDPATIRTTRNYYTNASECAVAVNALYGALRDVYSGQYLPLLEFPADYTRTPKNVDNANKDMVFYRWTAEHSMFAGFYADSYEAVNRCNNVIDNITAASFLSDTQRQSMLAEARFIRGQLYFNLVRCFGEIPVMLTQADDPKKTDFPKWKNEDIFKKAVIPDLEQAEQYLAFDYNSHRASGIAAKALLAKVYLWLASCGENGVIYHDWVTGQGLVETYKGNCKTYCEQILAAPGYDLYGDYYDLWVEANKLSCKGVKEMLFAINYVYDNSCGNRYCSFWSQYGAGTAPGWDLTPGREPVCTGRGSNVMAPTKEFYLEVQGNSRDQRQTKMFICRHGNTDNKDEFLAAGGASDPTVTTGTKAPNFETGANFAPSKYRHGSGLATDGNGSAQIPVIRLADVSLMYAEACGFGDQSGLDQLIRVRKRSYLPDEQGAPYSITFGDYAGEQEYIRDILNERKIELCFEMDRWYDLVRHGMIKEVVENLRMTYTGYSQPVTFTIDDQDKRSFFPIPNTAIMRNSALTQNAPWEGSK